LTHGSKLGEKKAEGGKIEDCQFSLTFYLNRTAKVIENRKKEDG